MSLVAMGVLTQNAQTYKLLQILLFFSGKISDDQRHEVAFTTRGVRMWWAKTDSANETLYFETQDEEMYVRTIK